MSLNVCMYKATSIMTQTSRICKPINAHKVRLIDEYQNRHILFIFFLFCKATFYDRDLYKNVVHLTSRFIRETDHGILYV